MQAVGLSGHQSAYDRIEDMAAHYIREMRGVQPKGPYCVGGSSVGGLIAYEVASQLLRAGEEVRLVVMFDTGAPGYPVYIGRRSTIALRLLFIKDRFDHHIETIRLLEQGKRGRYIAAKATKAKNQIRRSYKQAVRRIKRGVLTSLGRPLPDALVVTQNAIATAVKQYRPSPYSGKILLFRATKQHRGIVRDDTLGWSKLTRNNLEVQELQGDHGTLVVEPRVRFAAEIIAERLGRDR
jgi:thioesterase domain-containing protein